MARLVRAQVVDRRLGRFLPRIIQIDALSQGAALTWPVEGDDSDPELGQREKEVVELLDERIVSASENERAAFFAFRLKSEARQVSARIGNGDALVTGDTSHSERPVSGEVVIEPIAHVAGRQIELCAVVVRGGIQPAFFGLSFFRNLEPDRVPGIVVLDARCDGAELLEPRGRCPVEQWTVERVVHAHIGQHVQKRHRCLPRIRRGCGERIDAG
jgi:hypothetical protein